MKTAAPNRLSKAGWQSAEDATPATLLDGAVLLLLNPKAHVIVALMFTQFLTDSGINTFAKIILITTVFTFNSLSAFSVWTLA